MSFKDNPIQHGQVGFNLHTERACKLCNGDGDVNVTRAEYEELVYELVQEDRFMYVERVVLDWAANNDGILGTVRCPLCNELRVERMSRNRAKAFGLRRARLRLPRIEL